LLAASLRKKLWTDHKELRCRLLFEITKDVQNKFPTMRIGVVTIRDADNVGTEPVIDVQAIEEKFIERIESEDIRKHVNVLTWKRTYEELGLRKHRSTVDWLTESVQRSKRIPRINRLVTAYLAAELEFLIPIGGYDFNGLEGDILLRLSGGGETFLPLGKSRVECTDMNEVVYADSKKILTRNWNTKDCDQAKIVECTREAALFVEAPTTEISDNQLMECCSRLSQLLAIECGGKIEVKFFGLGHDWKGSL
jgi:DNA/RNA-binding domain of Phe-tRNA-synthetase-like protein